MPSKKTVATAKKKKTVTAKKVTKVNQSAKVSKPAAIKTNNKTESSVLSSAPQLFSLKANKQDTIKKLLIMMAVVLLAAAVYFLKDEVIVASVNGKPVTRLALLKSLEQQGAAQVLQSITTRMVINDAVKESGVKVEQAEIDQEMQSFQDTLAAQGQDLDNLLEAQGVSRKEIEEQIRLSKAIEKIVADQLNVSDEEVTAYYEENKASMPEGVTFDELSGQIKEDLRQQKLATAQQAWLAKVQSEADINYYKFAPTALY